MAVFGDLDMTVLDELPAGRVAGRDALGARELGEEEAFGRVRAEVAAGHQAYVVCPLVEGSRRRVEAARRRAAEYAAPRREGPLEPGSALGLLHGQLPAGGEGAVMDRLPSAATLDVLVATTVDRGGRRRPRRDRDGRSRTRTASASPSCTSCAGASGGATRRRGASCSGAHDARTATARLEALAASTDGFELAEIDLELRGEGTSSAPARRVAATCASRGWVTASPARSRAAGRREVARRRPELEAHALLREELELFIDDEEAACSSRADGV